MFIDLGRYLRMDWVGDYYVKPIFQFKYLGFEWVTPWPAWGMYAHFAALGLCAVFMALGYFYRVASALFVLGFGYVFLLEKAHYLNHFYVILILSFLLAVSPAHRIWSLDVSRRGLKERHSVPVWSLWLVRAQFLVIYVYAGIAKLNADWLHGQPMRLWLGKLGDMPLLGPSIASEPSYFAASYLGIFIDLVLPFFLLSKRTRLWAIGGFALFHLTNALLFSIGIFPWMMLACNLIFLDSDWPRRLPSWLRDWLILPHLERPTSANEECSQSRPLSRTIFVAISLFLGVQILLPLRHHLYPGDVAWTEEGHRFSWRMKLRDKRGKVTFEKLDRKTKKRELVPTGDYLSHRQTHKMLCDPDMIVQFAHFLAEVERSADGTKPAIFVKSECSLNGHPAAPLIDPKTDLTDIKLGLAPSDWILPRP